MDVCMRYCYVTGVPMYGKRNGWSEGGEERFLVLHLQIISSGWTISDVMYELNLRIHNLFRDPTDHEADP